MAESKQPSSSAGPDANAVYSLGASRDERARLQRQADELRPDSAALLDRVSLRPGDSAIDLGCGPRGVLDLLAERVSPDGRVIGVDADPVSVAMASEFAAERGLDAVRVLEGDARHTGLPSGGFDGAHTRTLLVTIPEPAEVVAEMVRLVRPGGWVASMEFDMEFSLCYPPHQAFARICEIFTVVFSRNGADPQLGRKVPRMFRDAGLTDVEVEARAPLYPQGHTRRTIRLDLVRAMRPQVLEMGLADEAELDELDAAARTHLADPCTVVQSGIPFLTWGRKPSGPLRFGSARTSVSVGATTSTVAFSASRRFDFDRSLRLSGVSFRRHRLDDPLEVVDGGELDGDLALLGAHLYLDPSLEQIRKPVGQMPEGGGHGLRGDGPADGLGGSVVAAEGDDLLHRPHREAFFDDPLGQPLLGQRRVKPEQRAGVARAEHAGRDAPLNRRWQAEQAERVADVRAGAADPLGELFVGRPEVVEQLLVGGRLLKGVELRAVQVLDERVAEHVIVGRLADDGRDVLESGSLRRPHPALAHHELVAPGAKLPYHHRLQQADLGDGGGELLECVFVEGQARLTGVRRDRADRHFLEVGAIDRTESAVAVGRRTTAVRVDGVAGGGPDRALRMSGVNRPGRSDRADRALVGALSVRY